MDRYWKTGQTLYIGDPYGDAIELTEEQYNKLKREQDMVEIRAERNKRIASIEWRIRRHSDELALGLEPTEDIMPVLRYIQALRDIPQQKSFPNSIAWPELKDNTTREDTQ